MNSANNESYISGASQYYTLNNYSIIPEFSFKGCSEERSGSGNTTATSFTSAPYIQKSLFQKKQEIFIGK